MNNKRQTRLKLLIFVLGFLLFFAPNAKATALTAAQQADYQKLSAKYDELMAQIDAANATSIKVNDKATEAQLELQLQETYSQIKRLEDIKNASDTGFWDQLQQNITKWAKDVSWSKAYQSLLSNSLNKIAYDTATWLGSGSKGQKPMFITEGWGTYLQNIGDNAAGEFIQELGSGKFYNSSTGSTTQLSNDLNFNLCKPNFAVQMKIGLGLASSYKPGQAPNCTFSQLLTNWDKSLSDPNFLQKFQGVFDPAQNDLGVALTLQTGLMQQQSAKLNAADLEAITGGGWNSITSLISDKKVSPPQWAKNELEKNNILQANNFAKYTGSALVDAANIFLNQLALTGFNTMMRNLGANSDSTTHPFDWSSLSNPLAGPDSSGGITAVAQNLRKIIQPNFTTRGDYSILSELAQCPNPTKAGPTECVINDKFSQAIQQKKTLGEALADGTLDGNLVFGFRAQSLEPDYQSGIPYRSMLILRKYRIIPVGWELGAQYINSNFDAISGAKTLQQMVDCFGSTNQADLWCHGLVDPSWVLKAPLNYCRKEGPGPEITTSSVTGSGSESSLSVTRNDKYCADEQSCVKENDDGTCKLYGYCTEEKRQWKFGTDSCEPINNTCQTYQQADGTNVSYLNNTLDYQGCSVDNAGCAAYCTNYDYASNKYACTAASTNDKVYLDHNAESCDAKAEGCHGVIRTADGLGTNLLVNSSFETDLTKASWNASAWSDWGVSTTDSYVGASALKLNAGSLTKDIIVAPSLENSIDGEAFTLSVYAKNCDSGSQFSMQGQASPADMTVGADWQRFQTTNIFEGDNSKIKLMFNAAGSNCTIDAIQLERNNSASNYADYGQTGLVYEKLAPAYLNCTGASTDPAECANFARQCTAAEVGCELYTSQTDQDQIPAKVRTSDQCVSQCVGFSTYLQSETTFDSLRPEYFIPKTAKTCTSQATGCDQFTNLDKLGNGAEAIEDYSYLRQCVKASDASCAGYYTWEGSNETGYQLKVVQLKGSASGPALTVADDATKCSEAIYKSADPSVRNADCREFYDSAGNKSYHLYSNTISCSDDCHPYRKTDNNVVKNSDGSDIASQAACQALAGTDGYNFSNSQCVICKNGGTWSADGCIYSAIPSEGTSCTDAEVGCREYTGSTGQNLRIVLYDDFEDGTTQNWEGQGNPVAVSSESNQLNGHSLQIGGEQSAASIVIGSIIKANTTYSISFIAKTTNPQTLNVYLHKALAKNNNTVNTAGLLSEVSAVDLKPGAWNIYKATLTAPNSLDGDELLVLDGTDQFYVDDLKVTEINNRYDLIKDSWQTPDACNQDLYGNPRPLYMLGCDIYKDRGNQTHYLKSFSSLCGDGSVGCELLIDTHNSASPYEQAFNPGDPSNLTVPADNYIYAVYDSSKLCDQADKGCERLGKPYTYDTENIYQDTYLKNDPDKYNSTMCTSDALNCGTYANDQGTSYFKNPGDMTCEWRQGLQADWGWYKKKVKRCDGTGSICLADSDCSTGQVCKLETADKPCDVSPDKTFGLGGTTVEQPTSDAKGQNWVGSCPTSESSCTELIDPMSQFSNNLLFNPTFSTIAASACDGWNGQSQNIKLEPLTLYRLAGQASTANNLTITCSAGSLAPFTAASTLGASTGSISLDLAGNLASQLFYSRTAASCTVKVSACSGSVELKKVIVNYQLAKGLDTSSCNGNVNFNNGCVLFNQRSVSGGDGPAKLVDNADISITKPELANPSATADANTLIKVAPDRVCDKWLSCSTKVGYTDSNGVASDYCSDVALCNQASDSGVCNNVLTASSTAQTTDLSAGEPSYMTNLSGYSKVGYANSKETEMQGDYPINIMSQTGDSAEVSNGNFEFFDSSLRPASWTLHDGGAWNANKFKVINNPVDAQTDGVRYPMEGKSFMRVGASFGVDSDLVQLASSQSTSTLSVYLNTKSLASGYVFVKITDSAGSTVSTSSAAGNDWSLKVLLIPNNFKSPVTINLYSDSDSGYFYADDIRIRPTINVRDNFNVNSSCRLYPESSSLACQYYGDSGFQYQGWYGYCLEHDRAPGNPNTCLLWWPGERIKGDDLTDENVGYQGPAPVYYCAEAEALIPVVKMEKVILSPGGLWSFSACGPSCASTQGVLAGCPPGYQTVSWESKSSDHCGNLWGSDDGNCGVKCVSNGNLIQDIDANYAWYEYFGNFSAQSQDYWITRNGANLAQLTFAAQDFKFYDPITKQLFDDKMAICKKVVKTVTESGNNMYWSGRVYQGSDYSVPLLGYTYGTLSNPFGSINPPTALNLSDWSGYDDNTNRNNPIYVASFVNNDDYSTKVNGGRPYSLNNFSEPNAYQSASSSVGQTDFAISPYLGICDKTEKMCLQGLVANTATSNNFVCQNNEQCLPFPVKNNPNQAVASLQNLFAQSYGTWVWNNDSRQYVAETGQNWDSPSSLTNGNGACSDTNHDNCAIVPLVKNIKLNDSTNSISSASGFVKLAFNSQVDLQQRPLKMYSVDWGDGNNTTISGLNISDKPDPNNPHLLWHLYSYWDLLKKANAGNNAISCTPTACTVTPRIKIQDNWGWCNGDNGTSRRKGDCTSWEYFGDVAGGSTIPSGVKTITVSAN